MGGINSGRRWRIDAKETTDDYRSIDVRRLKRENLLSSGLLYELQWFRGGEKVASLKIRTDKNRLVFRHNWGRRGCSGMEEQVYPVELTSTSPKLGGERPWFLCPRQGCNKRVAILYGGSTFACRHCHKLAYPSQREFDFDRAARRADRVRKKLDWQSGFLNGHGPKPTGMHQSKYDRLTGEHDIFAQLSICRFTERYGVSPLDKACGED